MALLKRPNNTHATHSAARLATSLRATTPEGNLKPPSQRQRYFHEGQACCEPPNNLSPTRSKQTEREPKPGVLTRESYTLAIHIVKPHKPLTHCPHAERSYKRQTRSVLLGTTGSGIRQGLDATRCSQPLKDQSDLKAAAQCACNTQAHHGAMNNCHTNNRLLGRLPSHRTIVLCQSALRTARGRAQNSNDEAGREE